MPNSSRKLNNCKAAIPPSRRAIAPLRRDGGLAAVQRGVMPKMGALQSEVLRGAGLGIFLALALSAPLTAEDKLEFEPDPYTQLLAHFNEDTRHPDYSMGWNEFAGDLVGQAEGYRGKGLDLTFPQFKKDFLKDGDTHTPRFIGWGFQPRGIIDYRQGTFEFWFKLPAKDLKRLPLAVATLDAGLARNVKRPKDDYYSSFYFEINPYECQYLIPFMNGDCPSGKFQFIDIPGFKRHLDRDQWHHFAMGWSPGEFIVYLDGRPLLSFDMTDKHGFALVTNAGYFLQISNIFLDELRISKNVRYQNSFEPRWRDGKRPEYAFTGNPDVKRYPPKYEEPFLPAAVNAKETGELVTFENDALRLQFDRKPGHLRGFGAKGDADQTGKAQNNGLLLWEGLERTLLPATAASGWQREDGALTFRQNFGGRVEVAHRLTGKNTAVCWEVTLENLSKEEIWIEYLLSLPVTKVTEFFDGSTPQTMLSFPRGREVYDSTLPFAAAAGNGTSWGVGIDPHITLNDLIAQWIPDTPGGGPKARNGIIRQGSRVALFQGERYTARFYVVKDRDDFGTLDAIHAYHQLSPDLYELRPDVPIYSYLPANAELQFYPFPEQTRQCYIGGLWGCGPGHGDGDEYGTPEWWDNPKFYNDPSYKPPHGSEDSCHSVKGLRKFISDFFRRDFDNAYPVVRRHSCPDLTCRFIVKELWPEYQPSEDHLGMGQYYTNLTGAWMVNEYNTPLGRYFIDSLKRFSRDIACHSSGWINDMSYIPNLRFNDPIAKKTNGRSFSRDMGTFVRGAMGRTARYQVANSFVDNGHRMSFWSDGGWFSYSLSAFSSANAIEGGEKYRGLVAMKDSLAAGRYLCGEKPFTVLSCSYDDWIGIFHQPEDFAGGPVPASRYLRDYYRYLDAQLALFSLKHGITGSCMYAYGHQAPMEMVPIIIESTVLGRKVVPAARVKEPLWVCRAGEGLDSFVVVGNHQPRSHATEVELVNRYFGGTPLFGAYYGGKVTHQMAKDITRIKDVTVTARDVAAFKILARLRGEAESASTQFSGDGLTLQVRLNLEAGAESELELNTFAPLYRVKALTLNGAPVAYQAGDVLRLRKGRNSVEAVYALAPLAFTKGDWDQVELIKEGRTNFRIVANKGYDAKWDFGDFSKAYPIVGTYPFGYERGTAMFLNNFIQQYDEEDGILDNLKPAVWIDKPAGPGQNAVPANLPEYAGWTVILQETPLRGANESQAALPNPGVPCGQVRIDRAARTIFVEGRAQGEMRRAMVVFLRLVDRKYPHLGRFMGLRSYYGQPFVKDGKIQWEIWRPRTGFKEFFEKIEDKEWVLRPLFREECEKLYEGGGLDFAGKYPLKAAPYLFEPTYTDNFVYGYCGPGRAETDQELNRMQKK